MHFAADCVEVTSISGYLTNIHLIFNIEIFMEFTCFLCNYYLDIGVLWSKRNSSYKDYFLVQKMSEIWNYAGSDV